MQANIETFIGCDASFEEAQTVLFGAPFDSTTSFRPGTRFASKAIRGDSFGLETYSPYQDKDLTEIAVFDAGDLELSFGRVDLALAGIKAHTADILAADKRPFMIGGEHLVTLGAFDAVLEKYPDVHVIQLDAHTDLRQDYLGAELSHATVLRRIWDRVGDGRIFQFGIRSGERAEFQFAQEHTHLQKFNFDGLAEVVAQLKGKPVYLTLDLDVLDPSAFPGTGTPEAGGVSFETLLAGLLTISELTIVGVDVNELSPQYDLSGASTALACKIIRELLLAIH
ncbi:agmatinase [Enterococcus saccharolyticus]|uniref:Agmatinase n=1 Tax=Enterococcus saccharolyticus subsp. saccharolyticus ATCC 43076 TaxID=1139996 RepID=S0NTL9_9ENTE|nr:agmatinase [Enterococcus saccharolyticus]EOT30352.1 agmatinase [Enterococcus saccharolyticus subsp. saccharolyticus ATCC 43076]EOT79913.1 agmatinase [Enterococcus saccharolyticus subsp. saccharolyticus ATCC 43076]OJG89287.1 agmatinase [Enterococcus saccharolyticus]